MSTIKEDIFNYLSSEGLQPQDRDYGIFFKYQMLNFLVFWRDTDERFLKIALPSIYDVDDNNRADVLVATNNTTRDIKVAKCFVPEDSVWVTCEQLLDTDPNFSDIIPRTLKILMDARECFYEHIEKE